MHRLSLIVLACLMVLVACGDGAEGPLEVASEFSGQGVVLPVLRGWELIENPDGRDLIVLRPEGEREGQEVFVYPDVLGTAGSEQAAGKRLMQRVVDQLRSGIRQEPAIDGPVEIRGAEQAHQLLYREIVPEGGQQDDRAITRLQIVAVGPDSRVALFSYAAPTPLYDEELAELLRTRAGLAGENEDEEDEEAGTPAGEGRTGTPSPTG